MRHIRRTFVAAALAATLLAGCGHPAPESTTVPAGGHPLTLLTEPIGHGCSDGSDVVGYYEDRPVTLAFDGTGYYWCDERDDLPGYDTPVVPDLGTGK